MSSAAIWLVRNAARFALAALMVLTFAPGVSADEGATVPAGFEDERLFGGLVRPTAVAFAPDGRVFVGEKSGRILVYDSVTDTTPTLFADLRPQVHDFWDRGMLGLAVHPEYPTKPYVYALYTYDPSGRWGDGCPNPPGSVTDGCVAAARLARLTAEGSGPTEATGSRQYLIEDWCIQFPSHSIGSLVFGPGPSLFVTAGDGASFNGGADYGQWGGSYPGTTNHVPVNPCGDPATLIDHDANPATPAIPDPVTSEAGAFRSQDYRTDADPLGLSGTVIRIDPITGAGWSANANAGSSSANKRRVVAYGFRNPFRVAVRPGTAEVWIGDVGASSREEINRLVNPSGTPVNFGWPCYEGASTNAAYQTLGNVMCTSLTADLVQGPTFDYRRDVNVVAGDDCTPGSSSISGLAFLGANAPVPAAYRGALLFADYSRRCIWYAPADSAGLPVFAQRTLFANLRRPGECPAGSKDGDGCPGAAVFLATDHVGHLVYVDYDRGEVRRIRHNTGNHAPSASFTATPTSGVAPLDVSFEASASSDPEGDVLSFAWDLDGDGQYDDATGSTTTWRYETARTVSVGLRVTDPGGASATTSRTIVVGGTPPVISNLLPSSSLTWRVGDVISFSASATDQQDGTLPPSAFVWTLTQEHCPSTCHSHIVTTFSGVRSGTFSAPDHEWPSHLRLDLTVTDSDGQVATGTRSLQPQTGTVQATSNLPGAVLAIGEASGASVGPVTGIVGGALNVAAPATVTVDEGTWIWKSWSNGGPRVQSVTVQPTATNLVATYVRAPDTTFKAITPVRLLDTRIKLPSNVGTLAHAAPQTFQVTGRGGIPAGAVAITANLTVTGATHAGFVTLGPTVTTNPTTSTLNLPAKDTRANGVYVMLDANGRLAVVYRSAAGASAARAQAVLDVTGYFVSGTGGATYHPLTPARFLDTRVANPTGAKALTSGVPYAIPVGGRTAGGVTIPADATAVTGNLTVTGQTATGYLSLTRTSQVDPATSTVNFPVGDTRANNVTMPLGTGGKLYVVYRGTGSAHAILDITGYYRVGSGGLVYVPLTPARIADTRIDFGITDALAVSKPKSLVVRQRGGVAAGAKAITGNLTVTRPSQAGYLTVTPTAQTSPSTSTLNMPRADTRANGFAGKLDDSNGRVSIVYKASSGTVHVIVDVTGYFH